MKSVLNRMTALFARLRPFAIAAACALLIFSSMSPAYAFGGMRSDRSDQSKGLEKLEGVQKESEKAISGSIDSDNDAESVIKNSQEGLNGVQGAANKENMISPDNAKGSTIEENIQEALEDVTP